MSAPLLGFPDFRWSDLPNDDTLVSGRGWYVILFAGAGTATNFQRLWALLRQTNA